MLKHNKMHEIAIDFFIIKKRIQPSIFY